MEEKGMPGVMCRVSFWEVLTEKVPDAYMGALLRAALEYAKSGAEPDFSSFKDPAANHVMDIMWSLVRADVDKQKARYMERMERRKAAARCRASRKNGAETGKEESG